MPTSVYFVTIILGVAGGVYIWHPVLQQIKLQQLQKAPEIATEAQESQKNPISVSSAPTKSTDNKQ